MNRSLALSILAAIAGSSFATPTVNATPIKSRAAEAQPVEPTELSEKQRIMLEVRMQVGSELRES